MFWRTSLTDAVSSSSGDAPQLTFCSIRSLTGGTVRKRTAGSLLEEIRFLMGRERNDLVHDDNFTKEGRRFRELCGDMNGGGLNRGIDTTTGTDHDICRTLSWRV
jgi:hypothetical protein